MNQFQMLWSKASEELTDGSNHQEQESKQPQNDDEDATTKADDKVRRNGSSSQRERERKVGPCQAPCVRRRDGRRVGVSAELFSAFATRGLGTDFGTALFAVADEIAVPPSGLSARPTGIPLSSHAYALVSHPVYGVTREGVRRLALAEL